MKLGDGREFDPTSVIEGGRYNVYDCEKGHELLSIDLDEGVTPMMVPCPFDGTTASWRFYRIHEPRAFGQVVMVWRKATAQEIKRARRTPGLQDHYRQGGLHREWTGAPESSVKAGPYWLRSGRHG